MNREAIKKVRDVIASLEPKRFTMEFWAAETDASGLDVSPIRLPLTCNTAGCVAGWTVATLADRKGSKGVQRQATILLGLRDNDAEELFCPPGYGTPGRYSQPHAVRVLDHLLATGEVDWRSTRRAKKAGA